MHPTDVALLGLALDIGGAILLARGFVMKHLEEAYYESRTFLDGNVFLLKSALLQRAEAWGGAILLVVGFLLQIFGSLHSTPAGAPRRIVGLPGLVELVAVAAGSFVIGWWLSGRIGSRQFYEYKLRNYTPGQPFASTTVADKEELLRAGVLYDVRPRHGEAAAAFATRLTEQVDVLGRKHRGKVKKPPEEAKNWS
jgi:hypothetical protein